MRLLPPIKSEMERLLEERRKVRGTLRTPHMQTFEEQMSFFESLSKPGCPHRYFMIAEAIPPDPFETEEDDQPSVIGFGGITNISWENQSGEISLLIYEDFRNKGIGLKVVDLLLKEGFMNMNLRTIYGECYACNVSGVMFWKKVAEIYTARTTVIPARKLINRKYRDSYYFCIFSNEYKSA